MTVFDVFGVFEIFLKKNQCYVFDVFSVFSISPPKIVSVFGVFDVFSVFEIFPKEFNAMCLTCSMCFFLSKKCTDRVWRV